MLVRVLRLLLVVVAISGVATAGYFLKQTDTRMEEARVAAELLRAEAQSITASIAEVRAAQVGYVAQGQGKDFWIGRVGQLVPALLRQMTDFAGRLTAPTAKEAFDAATVAVENFQKLDLRAQDFARAGNSLLAADLIFSDGLESTTAAATQTGVALNQELQALQDTVAAQRRLQLTILAGSSGGVLLIILILGMTGAPRSSKPRDLQPVESERVAPAQEIAIKPPAPDLSRTAQLCTDLARVTESRQLPALLERGAALMDASGIIVWLAQHDGTSLKPALSFGYGDQTIVRMGAIHRDANNAAAAAFRAGQMRAVNGALVLPLLTPDGCIGVMSAEMKGGSEKDERSQALAAILTAQLATLVSPSIAAADAKTAVQA